MTSSDSLVAGWQQQADQYIFSDNYYQAAKLYEEAILQEPNVNSYYWHLGLIFLLQGQESEAQTTWLLAMAYGESEDIEKWTEELIEVLETEAERRRLQGTKEQDYCIAWAIRQHIREINPEGVNNLLHLIGLSTLLKTYQGEMLHELNILELLKSEVVEVDTELLIQVLKNVLDLAPFHPSYFDFAETALVYVKDDTSILEELILPFVYKLGYSFKRFDLAASFTELGLKFLPKHLELLSVLASFYQDSQEYTKGIETAKLYFSLEDKLVNKIYANLLIMRGLMGAGGYWNEFCLAFKLQKSMLASLIEEQNINKLYINELSETSVLRLFISVFFFPYFQDELEENLKIRSQIARLAQLKIETSLKEKVYLCRQWNSRLIKTDVSTRRLKIGYISHCLWTHSVGWLARWVFQYHDRERFEINGYFMSYLGSYNPLQEWFVGQVSKACKLGLSGQEAAEKIYEDEIDILIDLDSLTLNTTCEAIAMKPAPIQVTWLGWDASEIPAVDYFIADPYVLPESAQDYYTEKIWRLPQTYIAVDGFEVSVPNLRRDQLDIPTDAVIYLTAQRGYKYHPDTARLQMQIIKGVPNSYFLVKGVADQESLKNFFLQIAESEGVSGDRLKFLPSAPSEQVHRANLGIADVVLDTYPYNGATTTMETLWMCVPIVTRVGQQFASRNSYTMMMNAGISEGIAWTDEEYLEWGIRLGKDAALREQISWKLRQSRQTAPLWNGKQFTREMEKAYEQMWQIYLDKNR
ncbi:MAG: O-linked N-acetylglucosamine transferase, SPINDLY family protein [Microcoleus sp.]|uniref:O-linked N-acetylglucosamine transferase, SPINDLY family protein n=1 Tax=Microcoleus sp. TaxID=44472 RepID=UPI003524B9FF